VRDGRWQEAGWAKSRQVAAGPEGAVAFERIIGRRVVEELFRRRYKDIFGEVEQRSIKQLTC